MVINISSFTSLLINMYCQGNISKEGDNIIKFIPKNNNIYLEMERKEYSKTFINESNISPGNDYKGYHCIFRWKDRITNRVLLELDSEVSYVFKMFDVIEEWMSYNNSFESICQMTPMLPNGSIFMFVFTIEDVAQYTINNTIYPTEEPEYVLLVKEYNTSTEQMIDRIKMVFSYNNETSDCSINDFMDLAFFVYCIDIAGDYIENTNFLNQFDQFVPIE